MPKTLFEKIWDRHVVVPEQVGAKSDQSPTILYIDLHLIHEVTSPQAFSSLRNRGLRVRRPDRTVATADHSTPTYSVFADQAEDSASSNTAAPKAHDPQAAKQVSMLESNCHEFGIPVYGIEHPQRGIVHVIGPELGLTQPGMTIVCGDSHTATHGAVGALAFGIGTSEVEHVLATQCLLQRKPKTFQVRMDGTLKAGVTSKDMILALIGKIGTGGGTGHVIEYCGEAIRSLPMEARMTLCNMSIEAGARAGMIAPDETTFEYLAGRSFAPQGKDGDQEHRWEQAVNAWRQLPSDEGAHYDRSLTLDVNNLPPMITYGTNPGMVIPIDGHIPDPDQLSDMREKAAVAKALTYMGLRAGQPLIGQPIDVVFLGSCTNGRISDLRQAATLLRGRKVAPGVRMLVVPGSGEVKRQAEAEGLDQIFKQAGADWRTPGCSMCIAMNGDQLRPGQYAVSTSNRNFEGRQGPGGRTFLASPLTAAASAIAGAISDARHLF